MGRLRNGRIGTAEIAASEYKDVTGDVAAIDIVTYGEGVIERDKYVNVWKQVDGNWFIAGGCLQ